MPDKTCKSLSLVETRACAVCKQSVGCVRNINMPIAGAEKRMRRFDRLPFGELGHLDTEKVEKARDQQQDVRHQDV